MKPKQGVDNQESSTEMAPGAQQPQRRTTVKWIAGISAALVILVLILLVRWHTLPTPKYVWPRSADDWSAWGTIIGAVGTIAAVVYAAQTLKTSSAAQTKEARDRRLQMEFLELEEAKEAIKLRPNTEGFAARSDEWGDGPDIKGAGVFVNNYSDSPFYDVQVLLPNDVLEDGVTLQNIQFWETKLIHQKGRGWVPDKWDESESPGLQVPGNTIFILGTVGPKECKRVTFDFSREIFGMDWSHRSSDAVEAFGRDILIGVTFIDEKGKTWQRTSRDRGRIKQLRLHDLTSD